MAKPVQYHQGGFPPETLDWLTIIPYMGKTHAALARYDGTLSAIENAELLLSPLTTQEAVLSSKIEGTQATMGDVLEFEAMGDVSTRGGTQEADIREVLNYRKAMHLAIKSLNEIPLCQRLIKEAHQELLAGVRGYDKAPGEYRRIPNWIGVPGCSIDSARYVPIPADKLNDAMSVWERYIHSEHSDSLVQLALLHAEFEALHPFLDGNGRIGRMIIPLFLYSKKLIHRPIFYISAYFEAHRDEYYERLLAVSRDGDWTQWVIYFLTAIREQAEDNHTKTQAILRLREQMGNRLRDITHSQYSIIALQWLFHQPIFNSSDFISRSKIPKPSATRLLRLLADEGILKTLVSGRGQRPTIYAFPELLNIAEGKRLF